MICTNQYVYMQNEYECINHVCVYLVSYYTLSMQIVQIFSNSVPLNIGKGCYNVFIQESTLSNFDLSLGLMLRL